jgi:hypothetical protein
MSLVTKRAIGLTAAAIVAATIVSRGQAPAIAPAAPAVGEVTVNTGYVLRMILQDQDKAIAFYADLLKLTMPPAPATPRVPANSATIAATAPAESNVIGARVRLTVIDTAQSIRFYRDALRIPVEPGAFGSDQAAVLGLKPEQVRVSIGQFPGSPTALELLV